MVTALQLSVAAGMPVNAGVVFWSHSRFTIVVKNEELFHVGDCVSAMVTTWFAVVLLPEASVNVQTIVVVPVTVYGKETLGTPVIVPEQLSVVVG